MAKSRGWFEEAEGKSKPVVKDEAKSARAKPVWPTAADVKRQETPIYDSVTRKDRS